MFLLALLLPALGVACRRVVPAGNVQIVAHQDDDLLFLSPSIRDAIERGELSQTIYLTAGDAGQDQVYWSGRELGMRAAYAAMADVPDAWTEKPLNIGGRSIARYVLDGNSAVSLVFLRLPDGNPGGTGYEVTGFQSLAELWIQPEGYEIDPLDGEPSYTRSELIDVLSELLNQRSPAVVRTADSLGIYSGDHSDHYHAGLFGFEAHRRYEKPHELRIHRGYNIANLTVNLSPDEIDRVYEIVQVYAEFDPFVTAPPLPDDNVYSRWSSRDVPIGDLGGMHGLLGNGQGGSPDFCLSPVGGVSVAGAALEMAPCADVPEQRFEIEADGPVRGNASLCLAPSDDPPTLGTGLELASCDGGLAQRFRMHNVGSLRVAEDLCVEVNAGVPELLLCSPANATWTLRTGPGVDAGSGSEFSLLDLGGDEALYRSFRMADVDGDGLADVCARSAAGLSCGLAVGDGSVAASSLWSAEFSDLAGWDDASKGTTLQLADLDGDGAADVCGRDAAGVVCALSKPDDSEFGPVSAWTSEFSDAAGGDDEIIYASLRLGDVNGDGLADLCGHDLAGIRCAMNDGAGAFAAGTLWLGAEIFTALGIPDTRLGRTAMLGDIDGDGADDYCEGGFDGVHCGLSDPIAGAFRDFTMRSVGEYADNLGWGAAPSNWRSLRLTELNGDGRADLCGRGGFGLRCMTSVEGRFSWSTWVAPEFSTGAGWDADERGSTIQLGDLDGDGQADACGLGTTTLRCTTFPN